MSSNSTESRVMPSVAIASLRAIAALMLREMSTRYGRTPGGYVWAILQPLGMIILLGFAFSLIAAVPVLGTSFLLFKATGFMLLQIFTVLGGQSASTQCAEHYLALTDFMDKPNVLQQINGQLQRVERTPIPEVLAGSAPELCRQVAALPFQSKYCFGMLSFAAEDVDVAAFNAGDPTSRYMVNQALVVLREAIWPAVPVAARPMLYVTAHTHTGHLELNFALPKMVYNATGKIRSYDPDPPKGVG